MWWCSLSHHYLHGPLTPPFPAACFAGGMGQSLVFAGKTKGGSIAVLLTSCLTGLESSV